MTRGFTLLEILLAITLTAITMAIIYGVVVSTIEAQQRIEEEILLSEIGPALLGQLRQDLEAVYQPNTEIEWFRGIDRSYGSGSRDRVDFVAGVMAFGGEDEYQDPVFHSVNEVGYQIKENPDEPDAGILYRRLDYFIDEEPLRDGKLTELYNRVLSFDVTYYDREADNWLTEWETLKREDKALPDAIRVDLKILVRRGDAEDAERSYTLYVTRPD
jgi:type II secretion system protein J